MRGSTWDREEFLRGFTSILDLIIEECDLTLEIEGYAIITLPLLIRNQRKQQLYFCKFPVATSWLYIPWRDHEDFLDFKTVVFEAHDVATLCHDVENLSYTFFRSFYSYLKSIFMVHFKSIPIEVQK